MEGQPTTESYAGLGDRELLRRFAKDADEQAFAEIVQRYERLVNAVCRRVIGSGAEVDDAFQATFLTLANRPRQIKKIQSLSSWLYSVAWRISVRLVRAKRRHPVQPLPEEQTGPESDPLQQIADDQDAVILDEELQTLPNKYRDVLVMTYFADQTSQQIADQLDVSKGTIDGRIRQGRNMLRVRLARRGVGIGALAAATHLLATETVSASPALVSSTIEVGTQTLSQSLPGTTDLSNLEPLVRPEITSMISVKAIISSVVGVVALAGLAGMAGGTNADGTNTGVAHSALDTAALEQSSPGEAGKSSEGDLEKTEQLEVVLAPTARSVPVAVTSTPGIDSVAAAFTSYPTRATAGEKWLYEMFDESIPDMGFDSGESLADVMEFLASHYSKKHDGHNMQVWFDTAALDENGLSIEDLKLSRPVSLRNIKLEHALKLILRSVSMDITASIDNEVLTITTVDEAMNEENYFVRTYNVASLLRMAIGSVGDSAAGGMGGARIGGGGGLFGVPNGLGGGQPAQFGGRNREGGLGGGGGGGPAAGQTSAPAPSSVRQVSPSDKFVNLVMEMTSPPALWMETDGTGGSIAVVGDMLVVRQNDDVHRRIVKLLNLLSKDGK